MISTRSRLPLDYHLNKSSAFGKVTIDHSEGYPVKLSNTALSDAVVSSLISSSEVPKRKQISSSLQPKVFIQHQDQVGRTPRRIEIQRKLVEYQNVSIADLIKKEGVVILDGSFRVTMNEELTCVPVETALEQFDDFEHEERSIESWIEAGRRDSSSSKRDILLELPARVFVNGVWQNGTVTGYEKKTRQWRVDLGANQMPLHRIYICFRAENPYQFAKRFASAVLRGCYHSLEKENADKKLLAILHERIESLNPFKEVTNFRQLQFETIDMKSRISHLKRIFPYPKVEVFQLTLEYRNFLMGMVNSEATDYRSIGIVPPGEFLERFKAKCSSLSQQTKSEWMKSTVELILRGLERVGGGWYNTSERDIALFRMSKLSNLLTLYRILLEDRIRDIPLGFQQRILNFTMRCEANGVCDTALFSSKAIIDYSNDCTIKFDTPKEQVIACVEEMINSFVGVFDGLVSFEHGVMSNLLFAETNYVANMPLHDQSIVKCKSDIQKYLEFNYEMIETELGGMDFRDRIKLDADELANAYDLELDSKTLADIEADVLKFEEEERTFLSRIAPSLNIGFFLIHLTEVRNGVTKNLGKRVLSKLENKKQAELNILKSTLEGLILKCVTRAENVESMLTVKDILARSNTDIESFKQQLDGISQYEAMIKKLSYGNDMTAEFGETIKSVSQLIETYTLKSEERKGQLRSDETMLLKMFKLDREGFSEKLRTLQQSAMDFQRNCDVTALDENQQESAGIIAELQQAVERADLTNRREIMFGVAETDYSAFKTFCSNFHTTSRLWTICKEWKDQLESSQYEKEEIIEEVESIAAILAEDKTNCAQLIEQCTRLITDIQQQ